MYILISIIILVCALLVLVVLVQNSKGGGLASNFASNNQVMGVRKTADFLEKATWALAIALVVLSILASATIDKKDEGNNSRLGTEINEADAPIDSDATPYFPIDETEEGTEEDAE